MHMCVCVTCTHVEGSKSFWETEWDTQRGRSLVINKAYPTAEGLRSGESNPSSIIAATPTSVMDRSLFCTQCIIWRFIQLHTYVHVCIKHACTYIHIHSYTCCAPNMNRYRAEHIFSHTPLGSVPSSVKQLLWPKLEAVQSLVNQPGSLTTLDPRQQSP